MAAAVSIPASSSDPRAGAASIAAVIAAAALLTLCGAWFFEFGLDIKPCPLCQEQRFAYYLVVPLAAVLAGLAARRAPRLLLVAGFVVIAAAMLGNTALATYHAGVEWAFWPGPTACSGTAVNLGSAGDLLQRLDTVKVVRCDEVQWRLFGLSLAGYNALISLTLAGLAIFGATTAHRAR